MRPKEQPIPKRFPLIGSTEASEKVENGVVIHRGKFFYVENHLKYPPNASYFKNAPSKKNQMYLKAKGIFRNFWEKQMKKLCNKGSLRNFSADAPIRCLFDEIFMAQRTGT